MEEIKGKAEQLCEKQQGWEELLWQEPLTPIPSKKNVHGGCAALGYAGVGVGCSSHSEVVTRTHRLPTRPTQNPSFCLCRSVLCLLGREPALATSLHFPAQ